MIPRRARLSVQSALARQAAVALTGPRQVGKTTLAHAIAADTPSIYLDLEASEDRAKLADPSAFLSRYEDRLVVLDEIHRIPELFPTLRGLIDRGRRHGRKTSRFLILGSASMDLLRQSGESLAGRIAYVEMGPLNVLETAPTSPDITTLWIRGGFPESYLASNDPGSLEWRKDFIRTYLERDVPLLGPRIPAETLERLWTMLAHEQAALLNASRLATSLMIGAQTVSRYIDLLVDLLLVRRLQPFHVNVGKRLVRSPKVFVRDSGIVHALLGIAGHDALSGHPVVGASWEGFAIENLIAAMNVRRQMKQLMILSAILKGSQLEVRFHPDAPVDTTLLAKLADQNRRTMRLTPSFQVIARIEAGDYEQLFAQLDGILQALAGCEKLENWPAAKVGQAVN